MKKVKKNQGLSLVEILIYVGIFGILSVTIINLFMGTFVIFAKVRANNGLLQTGSALIENLSYQARNAKDLATGGTYGTNPSVIALTVEDGGAIQYVYTYDVSSGILRQKIDLGTPQAMHSIKQEVTNFVVNEITVGTKKALRISLTLRDSRVSPAISKTFTTTVIIRGSY
jgi:type II secretory pathway pseudopilin PulG